MFVCVRCSLEDARRKRAKVKQEPGQGEASPAEPAAAQPAALSTKQRKKAEREVGARPSCCPCCPCACGRAQGPGFQAVHLG